MCPWSWSWISNRTTQWELYNEYPLTIYKKEIKKEMLSQYQLKITDLYNIPIGNVRKFVPATIVDKEKYFLWY